MSNKSNIQYKDISSLSDTELLEYYTSIKDEMEYQDSLSLSLKVFLNSNYGSNTLAQNAFSNGKLTAASVTISGRLLIQNVAIALSNEISKYLKEPQDCNMKYVVQADTDSSYINLDNLVEKYVPNGTEEEILDFIQKFFKKKLANIIQGVIDDVAYKLNINNPDVIKMDQEIVSSSFISIASKRYFARVIMSDGHKLATPKKKMTGISLVSKTTPSGVQGIMEPILDYILDHNELALQQHITDEYSNFMKLPIVEISRSLGVTSIDKYSFMSRDNTPCNWRSAYKFAFFNEIRRVYQTAPANSKAAEIHNLIIEEMNLTGKYQKIKESDKVYIIYVKTPNPITGLHNNMVAFKDPRVLDDIGITPYIDYQIQWQKEVIDKANLLLEPIGLEAKKTKVDLDDEW